MRTVGLIGAWTFSSVLPRCHRHRRQRSPIWSRYRSIPVVNHVPGFLVDGGTATIVEAWRGNGKNASMAIMSGWSWLALPDRRR